MTDNLEKYLQIQAQFPNKAGKLMQILQTQKRLTEELARRPQDDNTKRLLIANAEGYDVAVDLIEWFKTQLNDIMQDIDTIKEGAKMRNVIQEQSDLISFYMGNDISTKIIKLIKSRKWVFRRK